MPQIIEEFSRLHNRNEFDCGIDELNMFLQQQARQKTAKHIAKTYAICDESSPAKVMGYYTLTGYSVITPPAHKDYTKYPHPLSAVKLVRLAVDQSHHGQGLGEKLLVDAIYRTTLVAQQISAIGLFVDPTTPNIAPFYQQYGFLTADTGACSGIEMWLPITTCSEVTNSLKRS